MIGDNEIIVISNQPQKHVVILYYYSIVACGSRQSRPSHTSKSTSWASWCVKISANEVSPETQVGANDVGIITKMLSENTSERLPNPLLSDLPC